MPPDVLSSAAAATKRLGDEVVKGNYSYTIQRMYPRWKKRAAIREGGMEKLVEKLAQVPRQLRESGISMLSFDVQPPKSAFGVASFKEWIVFVPTVTRVRVIDPESRQVRRLEMTGYQVAVAKQAGGEWNFIDGAQLTVADLRSLFPTLPADREKLGLPPIGGREIKN
ncbi:MAG: hypothetical protein HKN82_01015 [Akkermansiaceae bacterium]|nr:hypothetical protein [Akkermansiaceae bacterium]NNM30769.1 hypothetical protein [Akkermansiaceae bacterium]